MKTKIKVLSLMLAVFMTISALGMISVNAEGELPINIGFQIKSAQLMSGDSFRVNTMLNFDDTFADANGILVYRHGLKFDPDYLELLDPNTMQPIEVDENGLPVEGKYYIYGDIGDENSFSVRMADSGNTLILLYTSRAETGDIYTPGPIAQFAFRVRPEYEITGSIYTSLEITNPEINVNNRDAVLDISAEKLDLKITPPFEFTGVGSKKQNSTLRVSGKSIIDPNGDEPLKASIYSGEQLIEEKDAILSTGRYSVDFELSEDIYIPGMYKLMLTYGITSNSCNFEILEKDAPVVIPDPDPDPTQPKDPEPEPEPEPENPEKPSDGGNGSTGGGGSSSGGSSSGGSGGGSGSSISLIDKPTTVTKPDEPVQTPEKPEKPAVTYPSDIAEHWAKTNIEYVYDHALMNGYEDGTFGPQNNITRAEFATVMSRFLKLADNPGAADKFADTNQHWAKSYIGALVDAGIVNGTDEASFSPDNNITRQEIATILARAFELSEQAEDTFADDAQISDWARAYVYSVRKAGYMQGDEYNNFAPIANATRAEVATIIYRLHSAK